MKMLLQAAIILLATYAALVVIVYFRQDGMVYFPDKDIWQTPRDVNLNYEEITCRTKDSLTISGWYIEAAAEKGVVLFCHGNGGNISHRLDSLKIFNSLDLSVLIFDYRGYGKSQGKPSEQGTYLDAEAAWEYLVNHKRKSPNHIILFGRSLGGAVAAEIASRQKPAALIIESSFTSVYDFGKKIYPWLPIKLLSKYSYATIDKINNIMCPKLIVHSPEDDIVPYEYGKRLFERASPPKQFLEIRGGHNDGFILSGTVYTQGLKTFIQTYLKS